MIGKKIYDPDEVPLAEDFSAQYLSQFGDEDVDTAYRFTVWDLDDDRYDQCSVIILLHGGYGTLIKDQQKIMRERGYWKGEPLRVPVKIEEYYTDEFPGLVRRMTPGLPHFKFGRFRRGHMYIHTVGRKEAQDAISLMVRWGGKIEDHEIKLGLRARPEGC